MKKILLGSLILCAVALPSVSQAQVGFGSFLDIGRFPVTCELPDFLSIPNCAPSIPAFPTPPKNFYDIFFGLQIEGITLGSRFLAIPVVLKLPSGISPSPVLVPGMQTLGTLLVGTPTIGGFFIPGFPAIPPYIPCIPSFCIPFAPAIGSVTPYTGAVPFGI